MSLNHLVGLYGSDRADQRAAFDLRCDAGAVATLRAAHAAFTPGSPDLAAFDVAITAADAELDCARGVLKALLEVKKAKAAAASPKKSRLAAASGAVAVPTAARAHR
jgi:hypothetical protein